MNRATESRATEALSSALATLATATASVARHSDHAEHAETAPAEWIASASEAFIRVALELAELRRVDLREVYAQRLRQNEIGSPLIAPGSFDGAAAVRAAKTWRDLQLAQIRHDRQFRPDVVGLSRFDQLRHYCLHLAKLVGHVAEELATPSPEFDDKWLPDILLMGIKLATVAGRNLSEVGLPWPFEDKSAIASGHPALRHEVR